jgi:nitrate reductase molybdenum cofactor assembly chaperone NarJ/NarW
MGEVARMSKRTDQDRAGWLVSSWLLTYPDETLLARVDELKEVVRDLPEPLRIPLDRFIQHLTTVDLLEQQENYVATFDMKRKTSLFLTYWTQGDTRNRGTAILRFKQAYLESGWEMGNEELPDHLAVLLEYAAIADHLTGEALLIEHEGPIQLLRDALAKLESHYVDVIDVVLATLPELTPEVKERIAQLAASGPPQELVGLEPYGAQTLLQISEVRR